jgi:3-oxoacyl-ACP reductase-like protein
MRRAASWISLAFDSWAMGVEASAVIGMRLTKLAAGGADADAEAQRMVAEKVGAAIELQMLAATGGLGTSLESAAGRSLRHVRKKVRANRRRLGRR